ncbi:MAG: MFS transporter [Flavobacteriaceae bacterium]|nr:MFS transporter [Flavobacteriaceae bacterium]
MKKLYTNYLASFSGLSKEIWFLALVTFINRAGTMILPFLSRYLNENLEFSLEDVGIILSFFGIGSLVGHYVGGKLTDKIGFYNVMMRSLLTTGFLFIGLQFVTTFWALCISIFFIMSIADMFRPAMFVSLKAYSKPENQTRSLALVRLAINLGFIFGPMVGGLLIIKSGYETLFWIDGITCILATILFVLLVKKKPLYSEEEKKEKEVLDKKFRIFNDTPYLIFLAISFLMGMLFMQLFFTMPTYHFKQFGLSEDYTGFLLLLNGVIIVILEMPLVHWIENKKFSHTKLFAYSSFLMGLSFALLLFDSFAEMLIIHMVIMTIAEMIAFPFTNTFAMNRAKKGQEGTYMAWYSISFSFAHILCPVVSFKIIEYFGYATNWGITAIYGFIAMLLSVLLYRMLKKSPKFKLAKNNIDS